MNPKDEKIQEYIKKNMRQFMVKVNRITEPELLEWLESQPNKQGYIKELIIADMQSKKGE